ncbi:MAG: AMP-binding protein [Verrucomicrobiales bacterium]|nr:AMP-binding protein [Verrucomicrobiales bacterium]
MSRLSNRHPLRKNWAQLDRDQMQDLQLKQLRRFLKQTVLPFSKHYRELFHQHGLSPEDLQSWGDLSKIPFTSKKDLLSSPEHPDRSKDFVIIPDEALLKRRPETIFRALTRGTKNAKASLEQEYRPIMMTSTTGRSSEPVPFFYSHHDIDNLKLTGRRLMEICESQTDFRHINLFPFAPHLAFWQAHYAGTGFNTFCISTGGGKVMGTSGNVMLIGKIQPDALIGMPTFIYHVLSEAIAEGVRCDSLKRLVLGGEKVPNGMRRKLRALAAELGSDHVEVMATYAFTESKTAWPECPAHGTEKAQSSGYHLYPDLGIIEIINPDTGESVAEGEAGEIVYTPLDSRGSVILRYRTGDLISGGITYQTCPQCGRSCPRLLGRISRVSDIHRMQIGKVKGTLVNFNDLEHILDDIDGLGSWQIEIRKKNDDPLQTDEIIVHAQAQAGQDEELLAAEITQQFQADAELRPNRIEFHDSATMKKMQGVGVALKEDKIVDHRPSNKKS